MFVYLYMICGEYIIMFHSMADMAVSIFAYFVDMIATLIQVCTSNMFLTAKTVAKSMGGAWLGTKSGASSLGSQ